MSAQLAPEDVAALYERVRRISSRIEVNVAPVMTGGLSVRAQLTLDLGNPREHAAFEAALAVLERT